MRILYKKCDRLFVLPIICPAIIIDPEIDTKHTAYLQYSTIQYCHRRLGDGTCHNIVVVVGFLFIPLVNSSILIDALLIKNNVV